MHNEKLYSPATPPKDLEPCTAIYEMLQAEKRKQAMGHDHYGMGYWEESEKYWKAKDNYIDSISRGGGTTDFSRK
mgnify:CR=1 FL=1